MRLVGSNRVHIDWFEAGWEYIRNYLIDMRNMREKIGISEPDYYGDELLGSTSAKTELALLVNPDYQAPLEGTRLDPMELWRRSYRGVFEWLTSAGYPVEIVDIKGTDDLSRWRAAVYVDPGLIGVNEAKKLADYTESGGSLIHMGWPSEADTAGLSSSQHNRWLKPFSSQLIKIDKSRRKMVFIHQDKRHEFFVEPPVFYWKIPQGAQSLLRADAGGAIGWETSWGKGRLIHITFDLGRILNRGRLYRYSAGELDALVIFAKMLMDRIKYEERQLTTNN